MVPSPPKGLIERILVALDASAHSRAALEAAVRLAARIDAELAGLFVEDEVLIRMADLPFTRAVRRFPAVAEPSSGLDMERQLEAQARRAERLLRRLAGEAGIAWSFRVVRGDVKAKLLAASQEADLITLGRLGQSAHFLPRLGSIARAVLLEASCPVLMLHHGVRLHPSIVVLYDATEAADHALHLAAQIAQRAELQALTILFEARDARAEPATRERIAQGLRPYSVTATLRPSHRFSFIQMASLFPKGRDGLLIVPRSLLGDHQGRLERLLTMMHCPVLLVR